jgi:prevent-host-death family protein
MCYMRDPKPAAPPYPARDEHMPDAAPTRVGVRELRQNLSVYLRLVEAGETLEVTEHGRPIARLGPLPPRRMGVLERLVAEGRAVAAAGGSLADLGLPPAIGHGPALSDVLAEMRGEDER